MFWGKNMIKGLKVGNAIQFGKAGNSPFWLKFCLCSRWGSCEDNCGQIYESLEKNSKDFGLYAWRVNRTQIDFEHGSDMIISLFKGDDWKDYGWSEQWINNELIANN